MNLFKENKNFLKYCIIRFAVIFALYAQFTALSYELFSLTQNALTLGLLGLSEWISSLIGAFYAGHYVDRKDSKRVLGFSFLFFAFISIFILIISLPQIFYHYKPSFIAWLCYVAMFFMGFVRAFSGPASFSILSGLVKKENYKKAIAISSSAWQLGAVLGPLLGGLLLAYSSITVVEIFTISILLISVFIVFSMHLKKVDNTQNAKESYFISISKGFKFIFQNQFVWAAITLDLFAVLFGGSESLLPVFSQKILQVGEVGYGWLRAAHGIGSVVMLSILSRYPLQKNPGLKLLFAIAGFGICIIGFGFSKIFIVSFLFLLFGGVFDAVSVVVRQTILQLKTPENMKGRVSSINSIFINSSNELGSFESGITASYMGAVPSVLFGGSMTLIVVLVMYFAAPKLKKMKL